MMMKLIFCVADCRFRDDRSICHWVQFRISLKKIGRLTPTCAPTRPKSNACQLCGCGVQLNDGDVITIALPSGDPDATLPMYTVKVVEVPVPKPPAKAADQTCKATTRGCPSSRQPGLACRSEGARRASSPSTDTAQEPRRNFRPFGALSSGPGKGAREI